MATLTRTRIARSVQPWPLLRQWYLSKDWLADMFSPGSSPCADCLFAVWANEWSWKWRILRRFVVLRNFTIVQLPPTQIVRKLNWCVYLTKLIKWMSFCPARGIGERGRRGRFVLEWMEHATSLIGIVLGSSSSTDHDDECPFPLRRGRLPRPK